jgi:hypothetical protein
MALRTLTALRVLPEFFFVGFTFTNMVISFTALGCLLTVPKSNLDACFFGRQFKHVGDGRPRSMNLEKLFPEKRMRALATKSLRLRQGFEGLRQIYLEFS